MIQNARVTAGTLLNVALSVSFTLSDLYFSQGAAPAHPDNAARPEKVRNDCAVASMPT
jgi:hypothetical protein